MNVTYMIKNVITNIFVLFLNPSFFFDYNRGLCVQVPNMDTLSIDKPHFKFIKWPISPKIKETHFKIIYKIYPVADFLKKRFKFEVDPCIFCEAAEETLEHMFFSCPLSKTFWSDLHNWLSLKIDNIPSFNLSHILFYMDNVDPPSSDLVNMTVLMGKYHIHCSKWKSSKPSFLWFINNFKLFFSSLKNVQSSIIARKMYSDISKQVLF